MGKTLKCCYEPRTPYVIFLEFVRSRVYFIIFSYPDAVKHVRFTSQYLMFPKCINLNAKNLMTKKIYPDILCFSNFCFVCLLFFTVQESHSLNENKWFPARMKTEKIKEDPNSFRSCSSSSPETHQTEPGVGGYDLHLLFNVLEISGERYSYKGREEGMVWQAFLQHSAETQVRNDVRAFFY